MSRVMDWTAAEDASVTRRRAAGVILGFWVKLAPVEERGPEED